MKDAREEVLAAQRRRDTSLIQTYNEAAQQAFTHISQEIHQLKEELKEELTQIRNEFRADVAQIRNNNNNQQLTDEAQI